MMTDDQLYQSYLAGDASAGDELMLRNSDALTAYLAGFLEHAQDAEDLMLDCFTVILVDKPRIGEGHFRSYLFKVARNKANRLWRLRYRRSEFSLDEGLIESMDDGLPPDEELWKKERGAILRSCINRIAPQYREALWLIYDMEMSYAQAAEVMSCGTKRIEDLLRNGKKRLRAELEKEGISNADI
ncbi:MAG: RNA polymerase sigma factor [Firmicutes bacterium]|nr:RNA polymerase sigma factor [Bacillota bacterium]MBQ4371992.1 RNA polymerase sigma factor [Bacillota bacterium]